MEGSPQMPSVLVIDKDPLQLELTALLLKRDNHQPLTTADPEEAIDLLGSESVDMVVLETSMHRHDGYRFGQQVRQLKPHMPILVVSERQDEEHVVRSLLAFADDYLVKPFSPRQLLARVHALLRRAALAHGPRSADGSLQIGEISLNLHLMQATVAGTRVALTPRELTLLAAFMSNPDRVLSRGQLIRLAWSDDFDGCLKTVDVCVQRLRKKMQGHLGGESYIEAVRGFGYKLARPMRSLPSGSEVPRELSQVLAGSA